MKKITFSKLREPTFKSFVRWELLRSNMTQHWFLFSVVIVFSTYSANEPSGTRNLIYVETLNPGCLRHYQTIWMISVRSVVENPIQRFKKRTQLNTKMNGRNLEKLIHILFTNYIIIAFEYYMHIEPMFELPERLMKRTKNQTKSIA